MPDLTPSEAAAHLRALLKYPYTYKGKDTGPMFDAMRMGAEALEASVPRALTPDEVMALDDIDAVWLLRSGQSITVESGKSAKMQIASPPKTRAPYGSTWMFFSARPAPVLPQHHGKTEIWKRPFYIMPKDENKQD